MSKISGFGWDDEQKMVLVDSNDVWQNYVRRASDAKRIRNRPFPFYEDWLILFEKDRATGELAEDLADAVAAMEKEDANANATTEEGEQSHVEQFSMNMGDMDYSMSTAKLLKLPMSNTQRLMTASMMVKDEDKVDLFFSLDDNDKMEWVSLLLECHI
ncbi:hypothetical protein ACSBR2_011945 [Camellia fascicularis]